MRTFHTGTQETILHKVFRVFRSYLKLVIRKVRQLLLKLMGKLLTSLKGKTMNKKSQLQEQLKLVPIMRLILQG